MHDPRGAASRGAAQDDDAGLGRAGSAQALAGTRRAHPQPAAPRQEQAVALLAPEVECIGKGKARKPYEFGVKVSLAVPHESGLSVGARSFPGNPFDGHTLSAQLEQSSTLLQDLGVKPQVAVVDLRYRCVDANIALVELIHRGK